MRVTLPRPLRRDQVLNARQAIGRRLWRVRPLPAPLNAPPASTGRPPLLYHITLVGRTRAPRNVTLGLEGAMVRVYCDPTCQIYARVRAWVMVSTFYPLFRGLTPFLFSSGFSISLLADRAFHIGVGLSRSLVEFALYIRVPVSSAHYHYNGLAIYRRSLRFYESFLLPSAFTSWRGWVEGWAGFTCSYLFYRIWIRVFKRITRGRLAGTGGPAQTNGAYVK